MNQSKLRLLIAGFLFLCLELAQASSFVPIEIPPGWNFSSIDVDAEGNYSYIISRFIGEDEDGEDITEGTLYLNGSPFVRFGPNERYQKLEQFAAAGSRVIFRAQTERIETPQEICGRQFQVFNGPDPEICPPYTPPTVVAADVLDRSIRANTSGEFITIPRNPDPNFRLYAPQLASFANPMLWWTPTWSTAVGTTHSLATLLENGQIAMVVGDCLRVYRRKALIDPGDGRTSGGLELDSESCVDISLTGGASIAQHINPSTGSLSFCASPTGFNGNRSIYLLEPGGTPQLVQVNVGFGNACRVFGSDGAGNVAFGGGSQLFWSDQPAEPVLASGHIFDGKELIGISPIAVLNDRTIVATAQLQDSLQPSGQPEQTFGLFFSDGDTGFPPDSPANVVIWDSVADGSFFDDQNWNPKTVPGTDQIAVFAPDAGVTVSFESQVASTERLFVERGPVIFEGGGYQLNSGSDASPSLVLRAGSPGDVAGLWLQGNHQLQTTGAVLDQGASSGGQLNGVIIEDDLSSNNPQSRWDNAGRLVVDASLSISWSGGLVSDSLRVASTPGSQGSVSIGPTQLSGLSCPEVSIAKFGAVSIGYAGQATMKVRSNCTVETTGDRIIGELAGSNGMVTFQDSSWVPFYTQGPDTKLTIGKAGYGYLTVWDGAVGADQVIIGQAAGSDGSIVVLTDNTSFSMLEAKGSLFVGAGGKGLVRTIDSGQVVAPDVTIGAFPGSFGRVFLTGPTTETNLNVAGSLIVGENGEAEMEIVDGAIAHSQSGLIGGGPQSRGLVEIARGGSWDIDNDLTLGLSSSGADPDFCDGDEISVGIGELRLLGDGQIADVTGQTLTIDGPDSRLTGTGLTVFQNTIAVNCAVLAPGSSPGTLTLNGDLEVRGGVIEVELFGLGEGQYDVLNVTGAVDISGSIVKFIFDGFLPQQGDQFTFLHAGGGLSLGDNMQYDYEGATDGFEFNITEDGTGGLVFSALNDAKSNLMFTDGFESP